MKRVLLGLAAGWTAHALPSVAAIAPLRRAVTGWAGEATGSRVALTFDDGPAPGSTPLFLDVLRDTGVHATFFVLGGLVQRAPELACRIVADGHEIGVHGWSHRPHLLRTPQAVLADLARTVEQVQAVTGVRPGCWRPPHGILTTGGLWAARRLGLRPVLWTVDGHDWAATATPETVLARITPRLNGGAVILLHDADTTSAPKSWRAPLAALPALVTACHDRGLQVGSWAEQQAAVRPGGPGCRAASPR